MCSIVRRGPMLDFVLELMDLVVHGAENRILAPKTGQREDTSEGQTANQERDVGDGHELPQAAKLPHVDDPSHGMHHRTRAEKEQSLEESVGEEVKHATSNPRRHSSS